MKFLFVCLGNICRSPSAEIVFQQQCKKLGLDHVHCDSAGTNGLHDGEQADPRSRHHAQLRGYEITHISRRFLNSDFENFDMILAMDQNNFATLMNLAKVEEHRKKIHLITDFLAYSNSQIAASHVPDPYYGGAQGFEEVLNILEAACQGLISKVLQP